MRRALFEPEHDDFRESFRRFLAKEVAPHHDAWERDGLVPRELFAAAGEHGFVAPQVPEAYGGAGVDDFRFNVVVNEEVSRAGFTGFGLGLTLHNDICLPYFLRYCTDEQKQRWLPGIASGELVTAVAMTEPGIGSDLASMSTKAIRDGERYMVDGAKTFITNGINADSVVVAARTSDDKHGGLSIDGLSPGNSSICTRRFSGVRDGEVMHALCCNR